MTEQESCGTWTLQEAETRFDEVMRRARSEGPQEILEHGESTVVVMSSEDYRRLTKPRTGLVEFLRTSPLLGVDLDLERDVEGAEVLPM